jgi:hypothetical protein
MQQPHTEGLSVFRNRASMKLKRFFSGCLSCWSCITAFLLLDFNHRLFFKKSSKSQNLKNNNIPKDESSFAFKQKRGETPILLDPAD